MKWTHFLELFCRSILWWFAPARPKIASRSLWRAWWAKLASFARWSKNLRRSIVTTKPHASTFLSAFLTHPNFKTKCFASEGGLPSPGFISTAIPMVYLGPSTSWRRRSTIWILSLTHVKTFGAMLKPQASSQRSLLSHFVYHMTANRFEIFLRPYKCMSFIYKDYVTHQDDNHSQSLFWVCQWYHKPNFFAPLQSQVLHWSREQDERSNGGAWNPSFWT